LPSDHWALRWYYRTVYTQAVGVRDMEFNAFFNNTQTEMSW
jgi:hypothetical protein